MKAAVLREANKTLSIEDVTLHDDLGPNEVLLTIQATGICRSDISVMEWKTPSPLPTILGHEAAALVDKVGSDVKRVKAGDQVIVTFLPECGTCHYCKKDMLSLCIGETKNKMFTGYMPDGSFHLEGSDAGMIHHFLGISSFAEQAIVSEKSVWKVPKAMTDKYPPEKLCLLGCAVLTAYGATTHSSTPTPGDVCAVIGCGGVGSAIIQLLATRGYEVIAIDVDLRRLNYAHRLGAKYTIDASKVDPINGVRTFTGNRGVDHCYEAVGKPETISHGWGMLAPHGSLVVVGITGMDDKVEIPTFDLLNAKSIVGAVYGNRGRDSIKQLFVSMDNQEIELDALNVSCGSLEEINVLISAVGKGLVGKAVVSFR